MTSRNLAIAGVLVGIGVGVVFALARTGPEAARPPEPPAAASAEPDSGSQTAAEPEPQPSQQPLSAKEWEEALGGDPEWVSEEAPPPTTGTVAMPLETKLAPEPLSVVPHELLGAWDDRPGSQRPGAHRAIVAVVDPSTSDVDLEQLVWDIRERHSEAEILDVRVYDSADAAHVSSALDGGRQRAQHLVAGVKRNDRLGYDEITVRGRVVGP